MRRMIIIGAGPMGIEAALGAIERGFDVTVLERDVPGASLRAAGSTRFFTPLGMNLSARAKKILEGRLPPDDALLTARELAERVFDPLAQHLGARVKTKHRVVSISRARMTRYDLPNHPVRGERAFSLLVETPDGEAMFEAEHVLDASGVYGQPSFLGAGGMPAKGERGARPHLIQHLGALETVLPMHANRRILLAGHGHSAANAIVMMEKLAREAPKTRVTWAVRGANGRPVLEIANDPLPERRDVVARANALAENPPEWLAVQRRAHVVAVERRSTAFTVRFANNTELEVDAIAAFTGYRPDHSMTSELAVEISAVSDGAGRIQRALANVTDCLNVPSLKPSDLASGEPGFHFAGIKSYGRMPTFLLQTGLAQLETILDALASPSDR